MPTHISSAAPARPRSTPNRGTDFPSWAGVAVITLLLAVATLHFERQRFADSGVTRPVAAVSQADLGSILP